MTITKKISDIEQTLYRETQKDNQIEERIKSLGDMIPYDLWYADKNGYMRYLSSSLLNLLGMTLQEACNYGWTKRILEEDVASVINKWFHCIKTGEEWEAEYRLKDRFGTVRKTLSRGKPVCDNKGILAGWVGINLDITDCREEQKNLEDIEWMINGSTCQIEGDLTFDKKHDDLIEYDESGYIVNATGIGLLMEIVTEVLDLLDSFVCVFEQDGHCSFKIIRSVWCCYLNDLSKKMGLENSKETMRSDEMSCFLYWKKVSENVINTGVPADVKCKAGIGIFCVPVKIGGETTGSICIGYGNPPQEEQIIRKIALYYGGDYKLVKSAANNYKHRPAFLIETARKSLLSSARIIEIIVSRKRAENAIQLAYSEAEKRREVWVKALNRSYELLKKETKERIDAENKVALRNEIIESIYSIISVFTASHEVVINKVISSINSIFAIPFVAVGVIEKNMFVWISQNCKGRCECFVDVDLENHPCGIAFRGEKFKQLHGNLKQIYPPFTRYSIDAKTYLGIPVYSSNGIILGTVCLCDDENRVFKEYEINLIEIFARFTGHVLERRLIERQLSQSQEMKILGQLTSGVAHEVRNPLNGILAITDALSKDLGGDPEYSIFIEHIRKQVVRLTDLMSDLLDLGRPIEKGNLLPTSIVWLISTALNYWKQSSCYRNRVIKINCSRESESVTIYADRPKIEQVIINLLENGCAHSSSDQEIIIGIKRVGDLIVIQITDRGTGIKPEHLDHLFDPFFTTRKGGTGLGLGIVKRIIESHGGSIDIRNNIPPPGVTAEVKIPIMKKK